MAISPDGSSAYVTNEGFLNTPNGNTVSVIDTKSNKVIATIPVGTEPVGVAVSPDGSRVYVANQSSNNVSVIDAKNNVVITTIPVGSDPVAFGIFIQAERLQSFAGTPGQPNCFGQSVAALTRQYGGLNAAAAALGYPNVPALQQAIMQFCEG